MEIEIAVITTVSAIITTLGGGAFSYLLNEIKTLKETIRKNEKRIQFLENQLYRAVLALRSEEKKEQVKLADEILTIIDKA